MLESQGEIAAVALVQKHFYKIIAKNKKGANAEYTDSARNNKLDTEGVAHSFGVTDAVILRGENTRTGNRAEYSEVRVLRMLLYVQ